jgi:uncharacterized membrane protein YbaN (DUF454 family)
MVIIWKFWKFFLPAAMPEILKKSSTTLPSLFSMIPNYKNTIIFYCQKKMTPKKNIIMIIIIIIISISIRHLCCQTSPGTN